MKNKILLRKFGVHFKEGSTRNLSAAMSVQSDLMKYGFMLDGPAFDALANQDLADIKEFYTEVVTFLKEATGANKDFKPLFGNFPKDVLSMPVTERRYRQYIHYLTNQTFEFQSLTQKDDPEIFQEINYKMLKLFSNEDVINIYVRLAESGTSLTPVDQEILKWFGYQEEFTLRPVTIKFKENLVLLYNLIPGLKLNTVTDVLRLATHMSGGDASLPPIPGNKFKRSQYPKFNLTSLQKEQVFELLENSNLNLDEMNTSSRYGRFIRLAETLGKIDSNIYPRTFNAFRHLRNQVRKGKPNGYEKIRSWAYNVDQAFKRSFKDGVTKLAERPGEFIRKIDWMVRTQPNQLELILSTLAKISENASNKTLFEVMTHFKERNLKVENRTVFIKGHRKPVTLPKLSLLDQTVIDSIEDQIWKTIFDKFRLLEPMGSVYIDPELRKIPLPTNMRSLSDSLIPTIRGQRTPLGVNPEEPGIVRAFCHWFNDGSRRNGCDIDLTGILVGKNGKTMRIGWNGEHKNAFSLYSGDITDRRGACAEYIDIDIKKAVAEGYAYLILDARDYRHGGFHTYSQCVTGFNIVSGMSASISWKPNSIANCSKLTTKSDGCILAAIDLKSLEWITIDVDSSGNTASGSMKDIQAMLNKYIVEPKMSIYSILEAHVLARKGMLTTPENAEEQFLFTDFSTDYSKILPWMGV